MHTGKPKRLPEGPSVRREPAGAETVAGLPERMAERLSMACLAMANALASRS